jgi:hypothetical protein
MVLSKQAESGQGTAEELEPSGLRTKRGSGGRAVLASTSPRPYTPTLHVAVVTAGVHPALVLRG